MWIDTHCHLDASEFDKNTNLTPPIRVAPSRRMTQMVGRLRHFFDKLSALVAVGPTRSARARLTTLTFWLWLKKRFGRRGCRLYRVTVGTAGTPVKIEVSEYTDLEVIREVFAGDIYLPPAGADPAVILDIGSNVGNQANHLLNYLFAP